MDIDLLSKMVAELILDNDEVALPGVGSFIAEFVPSSFSDKGYTINPPYRRLSFRQRESSDTKLIDFYAAQNHLDTRTAASILAKFLLEMSEILKTKKTIVFPGLGRLRATKENNFFFIPNEDLNIYPEGFGLGPVSLKTHVETDDEVQAAVENLQSILGPLPVPAVEIEPAAEPAAESRPAVESKSITIPETAPTQAVSLPSNTEEQPSNKEALQKKVIPAGWKVAIFVSAAVVLFFILFLLISRLAPDFIDKILYNEEELEIIRTFQL